MRLSSNNTRIFLVTFLLLLSLTSCSLNDLEELPDLVSGLSMWVRLFLIVTGLAMLLAGYKIYQSIIQIIGFVIGGILGAASGALITGGDAGGGIFGFILGGVLGAVAAMFFVYLGVFLSGLLGGAALISALWGALFNSLPDVIPIIGAIVGAIVMIILFKFWIIAWTAALGAIFFGIGIGAGPGWWVLFFLIGIGVQYGAMKIFGGEQINVQTSSKPIARSHKPLSMTLPNDLKPEGKEKASFVSLDGITFTIEDNTIIGRGTDCNLILKDIKVSRQHARIVIREGIWFIQDIDSTHGIYVNGEKVKASRLDGGETIRIGKSEFIFRK